MEKDEVADTALENIMLDIGVLDASPEASSGTPSNRNPTSSTASSHPVGPSQNLVGPSGQLKATGSQSRETRNRLREPLSERPLRSSSLSEQALKAKGDLEVLVATGKTQDFLGKQLSFYDLDYMSEKDILKYHRIYQSALAVRVNDTFGKIAIKTYSRLASWLFPIQDEDKLYNDLRSDYILMNELDRWTGFLSLRMGGLMAVATTTLITASNCATPAISRGTSSAINEFTEFTSSSEFRSHGEGEPGTGDNQGNRRVQPEACRV